MAKIKEVVDDRQGESAAAAAADTAAKPAGTSKGRKDKQSAEQHQPSILLQAILSLVVLALALVSASYIVTDTWDFGGLSQTARVMVKKQMATERVFSVSELAQYDGSDPSKPIYIALEGIVYDVTEGRNYYGPGGGYEFFAGKDATRAYITGCFKTHLTHDLRGLSDAEAKSISTWTNFYAKSKKYFRVGTVDLPPIDPSSPIPEPCN
eukprot:jgi/Hompol1/4106/HPOL_001727-RA